MGFDIAAAAASAAATAYGTYAAGKAGKAQAESSAQALEMQARAEEARANQERAVAQRQAEGEREKAERLMSRQQAVAASSGGGTGGSAAEIIAETGREGEYRSDLTLWESEEKARGRADQAALYRWEAGNKREQGKQMAKAGLINAGASLMGTVGSIGGKIATRGVGSTSSDSGWITDVHHPDGRTERIAPKKRGTFY